MAIKAVKPSEENLGKATITSIISGGRRKLHYTYENKCEKMEEYDKNSHELLLRKWKMVNDLKDPKWVYEIGEDNL